MTAKNAPKPLKTHARASVNSLISAVENLYELSKGQLQVEQTMQARAAAGVAMPTSLPVKRPAAGPLAAELETLRLATEALLETFSGIDNELVLPRVSTAGERVVSVQGKKVLPAKHAAAKFREKFGADPRTVESEFEDEMGERRVKIEGFANSVARAYVVATK
jgi:hypothetical protein